MDRLTVYSQLDQIEETPCFSDIRLTEIRVDQEIGFRHVDTKKPQQIWHPVGNSWTRW